jgi:hypothetical protein
VTDQQVELLLKVAGLCAIGAFWPLIKSWLAKRGIHYRSMKEQREIDKK